MDIHKERMVTLKAASSSSVQQSFERLPVGATGLELPDGYAQLLGIKQKL